MTDQPNPTTQVQEYATGREAREAGRKRFEEANLKPVEREIPVLRRPLVVKLGSEGSFGNTGRMWLEVQVRGRQDMTLQICRTDGNTEIEIARAEMVILAREIDRAIDDYDAASLDAKLMKEFRERLKRWDEDRNDAGYKAEAAWERQQAGESQSQNEYDNTDDYDDDDGDDDE